MGANDRQEGGKHYQMLPQPWDVIIAWDLNFLEGNVVKYVARWKNATGKTAVGGRKGGLEDLRKARHYLDKLIETVEAQEAAANAKTPA